MLTLFNRCIYVALCSAAQLVASIGQKADPAAQSLRFTVYFWRQASINGGVAVMKQNARTAKKRFTIARGSAPGRDCGRNSHRTCGTGKCCGHLVKEVCH